MHDLLRRYYILTNDKSSSCRKTTITKHIRKEHSAEPIQENQDAKYSDDDASDKEELEEDTEESNNQRKQSVGAQSQYNRNLWRLPAETVQRSSPLRLQRPIPHSEAPIHEIELERSYSTSQRSLSDSYPTGSITSSEYSHVRATTMPDGLPQVPASIDTPTQYPLRNNSNIDLSSPHSLQDSFTSLTYLSPTSVSTQSYPLFLT